MRKRSLVARGVGFLVLGTSIALGGVGFADGGAPEPAPGTAQTVQAQTSKTTWTAPTLVVAGEGGFTHTSDTYGGPAKSALFGVDVGWQPIHSLLIWGAVHDERGSATYYSVNPSITGSGPQRLDVAENRSDLGLGAGWIVPVGGVDVLAPTLGGRYLSFDNSAYPSYLAGARLGVADSLLLSEWLSLDLNLGWTYGLANHIGAGAALGAPIDDVDASLLATVHIDPRVMLSAGYAGELVAFTYSTRRYDGLMFSVGVTNAQEQKVELPPPPPPPASQPAPKPKPELVKDTDGDGIPDNVDKCPTVPEDKDGFEDADGCPDPDNDKDGIPDVKDKCPNQPEDKDGFEDADGCPDPDNDKDGILDVNDDCPNEPGPASTHGCPQKYKLVIITKEQIKILQQVFFQTDKARIKHESYPLLDEVAKAIKEHPEIELIEIQGHTDKQGSHDHNLKLSQARADAVRQYLVKKGVSPKRLVAKGYGFDVPIADNRSEAGRAQNRRVQFMILKQSQ